MSRNPSERRHPRLDQAQSRARPRARRDRAGSEGRRTARRWPGTTCCWNFRAQPTGRLRPFEIEKVTLLAQYNLSRLLDRLEKEGLVAREPCADDARGQWVVITEKGRATQARTWKVYAKSIQKHVGEKLDDKAAAALAELLGRLTDC